MTNAFEQEYYTLINNNITFINDIYAQMLDF